MNKTAAICREFLDETKSARCWTIPKGASRGVEVLFSLLIDSPRVTEFLREMIGGDTLDRILHGEIIPEPDMAEVIGQATGGKVTEAMFHERGLWPLDEPEAGDLTAGAAEARAVADAPVAGVLGETPAGPLFTALVDGCGQAVEVHGLGLSFRLGRSAAFALYDALGKTIAPLTAARA